MSLLIPSSPKEMQLVSTKSPNVSYKNDLAGTESTEKNDFPLIMECRGRKVICHGNK